MNKKLELLGEAIAVAVLTILWALLLLLVLTDSGAMQ